MIKCVGWNLEENDIGAVGASGLADGIVNLSLLTYLHLNMFNNKVGDTGV